MLRGNNALYRVAGDSAGECLGIRLKICCGSSMDGADEQLGKDGEPGGIYDVAKIEPFPSNDWAAVV